VIWHLLPASRAADFPLSGSPFLHACPDLSSLIAVANALYRDADVPMVALGIDETGPSASGPSASGLDVRFEPADPAPPPGVAADVLFPHIYGPVPADAVVSVRYARRDPAGAYLSFDLRPATAEALDLFPHPEGGWFRETWRSPVSFTPPGYPASRAAATLIYFLLTPGSESRWHQVRSDETWLWHSGGPLTLETRDPSATITLGPDLAAGQLPHHVIPGGTWQTARPSTDTEVLVSCVVAPGFDYADFTAT
jgi:uncharacterized protein